MVHFAATKPLMELRATASDSAASTSSSSNSTTTGSIMGKDDFMKLLILQLKNQDPLNPVADKDFIAQMAQLSSLEATNDMSSQVSQLVSAQERTQALQMVGHQVQYLDPTGKTVQGMVSGVRISGSSPTLLIGGQEVGLGSVQNVL